MELPKRGEEPGIPVTIRISTKILDMIDDARGRLNRQQWIRKVIVERLQVEEKP